MILKDITLENIGPFDKFTAGFPERGIIPIVGGTGSGKSILLKAIYDALYFYGDRHKSDLLQKRQKFASIRMTFQNPSGELVIERSWKGNHPEYVWDGTIYTYAGFEKMVTETFGTPVNFLFSIYSESNQMSFLTEALSKDFMDLTMPTFSAMSVLISYKSDQRDRECQQSIAFFQKEQKDLRDHLHSVGTGRKQKKYIEDRILEVQREITEQEVLEVELDQKMNEYLALEEEMKEVRIQISTYRTQLFQINRRIISLQEVDNLSDQDKTALEYLKTDKTALETQLETFQAALDSKPFKKSQGQQLITMSFEIIDKLRKNKNSLLALQNNLRWVLRDSKKTEELEEGIDAAERRIRRVEARRSIFKAVNQAFNGNAVRDSILNRELERIRPAILEYWRLVSDDHELSIQAEDGQTHLLITKPPLNLLYYSLLSSGEQSLLDFAFRAGIITYRNVVGLPNIGFCLFDGLDANLDAQHKDRLKSALQYLSNFCPQIFVTTLDKDWLGEPCLYVKE